VSFVERPDKANIGYKRLALGDKNVQLFRCVDDKSS
jgi:hypothetical protein